MTTNDPFIDHPPTWRANEDLENRFNYHAPDDDARRRHQAVRDNVKNTAYGFEHLLPAGREKSLALTKLEEAMFWANAAIARQGTAE